jgi:glycosyltransferase involved in cell wall biosynthesis
MTDARPALLVLASTYPRWPGDPEPSFVHALAKNMTEAFEVHVLGPHAPGAATEETMDGVHVHRYRYAPVAFETLVNDGGMTTNLRRAPWKWLLVPGFLLAQAWSAWRLVHRTRAVAIHAHWLLPQGMVAALLQAVVPGMAPYLVTSHGADLYALRAAPFRWLKRFVLRRAGAVTVVSSAMRDELVALGYGGPAEVRPMGVDLDARFVPDAAIERSGDEVLFVGRIVEKKGLPHLIDAMPRILERHPAARLTVAGFGPDEAKCRARVAALGLEARVGFLGAVAQSELPKLYRRAAVFVAPFVQAASGDREGLGLVVVEALGCGCPVVTTRVPAVLEVLGEWPPATAEPGSADSLAECVGWALAHPAEARADATDRCERLRRRFGHRPVADGYVETLRRIAGHSGSGA